MSLYIYKYINIERGPDAGSAAVTSLWSMFEWRGDCCIQVFETIRLYVCPSFIHFTKHTHTHIYIFIYTWVYIVIM